MALRATEGALFVSTDGAKSEVQMYQCKSGKHWWLSQESAERCCDPAWQRVLVIEQPGERLPAAAENPAAAAGVRYGRAWVQVGPNSGDNSGAH